MTAPTPLRVVKQLERQNQPAAQAVEFVEPVIVVGLGSGSTAAVRGAPNLRAPGHRRLHDVVILRTAATDAWVVAHCGMRTNARAWPSRSTFWQAPRQTRAAGFDQRR
jgi:hypothetical protein